MLNSWGVVKERCGGVGKRMRIDGRENGKDAEKNGKEEKRRVSGPK
jgi:hypothetical protein